MTCDDIVLLEFLRCELSKEREAAVWQHLDACPECSGRIKIVAALEAFYRERRRHKKIRQTWLLAAALLLVFLALPLLILTHPGKETSEVRLEAAGMATSEAHPYFPLQTRAHSERTREREQAFDAYISGDLRRAETLLAQLEPSPEVCFYLGVTRYLLGELDTALESLDIAYRSAEEWRAPAAWYLANARLRMGDLEQARRFLSEAAGEQGPYRDRAGRLLKDLEP
jgi:tetratricopeptide (TPR) repeat protein